MSPEGIAPSTRRLEAGCSSAELRGPAEMADRGGLAPRSFRAAIGFRNRAGALVRCPVHESGGCVRTCTSCPEGTIRFQDGPGALVPLSSHAKRGGGQWSRPTIAGFSRDPSGFQPVAKLIRFGLHV